MPFCRGQAVRRKREYCSAHGFVPEEVLYVAKVEDGQLTLQNGPSNYPTSVIWWASRFEAIPLTINPRWLTSSVVALAQTIQASKTWENLPILADALEEAGCDDESILGHFRGRDDHYLPHSGMTECGYLNQLTSQTTNV